MKRNWLQVAIGAVLMLTIAAGVALADRQTLTKTTAPDKYASAGALCTFTEADTSNKEQFVSTGNELIMAWNTGGSERNVTITSVADEYGRTGNIAQAVAANSIYTFGPFPKHGWTQAGTNYIYLEADHTDVDFAVIKLP